MKKYFKIIISGFLPLFIVFSCATNKENSKNKFQGMWRLDKYEVFDAANSIWVTDSSKIGYTGVIIYDGKGHMGVQLLPEEFKSVDQNKDIDSLSKDDLKTLVRFYQSNFVYFANYNLSDSMVEHKILLTTNSKDIGLSLKRDFYFHKDTLILTPHVGFGEKRKRLRWIKL